LLDVVGNTRANDVSGCRGVLCTLNKARFRPKKLIKNNFSHGHCFGHPSWL